MIQCDSRKDLICIENYRCNFKAYCIFSFLNTIVYCLPAGWVWGEHGFLNKMGAVDIAGSGPVHLVGGASAFASAVMLGPRLGRYQNGPGKNHLLLYFTIPILSTMSHVLFSRNKKFNR